MPHPILNTTSQKLLKKLLAFLNLYQQTKNQFMQLTTSWDTANFRVLRPEWHSHPNIFQSTFSFHESASTSKIRLFHQFFLEIVNLKIVQVDWSKAFSPISQEPDFPKCRICARIQQLIKFFATDQIHNKKTKFFSKFKKPYFWPISPHFFGQIFFFFKKSSCHIIQVPSHSIIVTRVFPNSIEG